MIRTPPGWGAHALSQAYQSIATTSQERLHASSIAPEVRRIGLADLRWALTRGMEDFGETRTDVIALCIVYPLIGLLLARLASGYDLLPLVFPLASGFALLGPLAAVGLNEMSRRRELGEQTGWSDGFHLFRSPSIGPILLLGGVLLMMFIAWLVVSNFVYNLTLGPQPPESLTRFVHDVFFTRAGWTMAIIGVGSGFVFAVIALTISAVSFPMLLDRNVSLETAVRTSAMAVWLNPLTMAVWGLIIAGSLVIGSIPALLGLIVVMPVLGHATWHLYRRLVVS
jgi:uncharacterized membrane protein